MPFICSPRTSTGYTATRDVASSDEVERTSRAVAALIGAEAEALIHCGDLTVPEVVLECGGLPSYFVFGNNDCDNVPDLRRAAEEVGEVCLEWGGVVELGGKRVGITHGRVAAGFKLVRNYATVFSIF